MITEDYVDFETAKLLKAKSADFDTDNVYTSMGRRWEVNMKKFNYAEYNVSGYVKRPTLQMAMKWLREIYSLEIYPYHDFPKVGDKWWFEIIKYPNSVSEHVSETAYDSYEEACEAGIKYCLKKLI